MSSSQQTTSDMREEAAYTPALLAGDVFTSAVIGLSVAAPVTIIDYSIMMKVSGVAPSIRHGLKEGFSTLLLRPHHFFLRNPANQYALIYRVVAVVYSLTYLSSNVIKHAMEARGCDETQVNVGRGLLTGVNNTLLTMWKDSFILQRLPPSAAAGGAAAAVTFVPMLSRVGFCVRDIVTCVAAFTLVPMFTQWMNARYSGDAAGAVASNGTISAVAVPASMQIATTFIHIAAIRYQRTYPNPSWADITQSIRTDYAGAAAARIGRIAPAFGIGGIGNAALLDTTTRWARDLDRKRSSGAQ